MIEADYRLIYTGVKSRSNPQDFIFEI